MREPASHHVWSVSRVSAIADGTGQRSLPALVVALLVANLGFGITLTVLPFHVAHLAVGRADTGATARAVAQIGALTAVYPALQIITAPAWGRLSDRTGRRPVLVAGMTGAAVSYLLFATAASLGGLYVARALGGIFAAAVAPAAAAYVADVTTESVRRRVLAWTGGAAGLGAIAGPVLGGVLTQPGVTFRFGPLAVASGFSLPFVAAAVLALVALVVTAIFVPATGRVVGARSTNAARGPAARNFRSTSARTTSARTTSDAPHGVARYLLLAFAAQLALALFETTFPLYAARTWGQAPRQIGVEFAICGVAMVVAQLALVPLLDGRVTGRTQLFGGFVLFAAGVALLPWTDSRLMLGGAIAGLGTGLGVVTPNILTEISLRAGSRRGALLGLQTTAEGVAQAGGAVLASALIIWRIQAPLVVALLTAALTAAWLGAERLRPGPAVAG